MEFSLSLSMVMSVFINIGEDHYSDPAPLPSKHASLGTRRGGTMIADVPRPEQTPAPNSYSVQGHSYVMSLRNVLCAIFFCICCDCLFVYIADMSHTVSCRRGPAYSLVGRKQDRKPDVTPGPGDYASGRRDMERNGPAAHLVGRPAPR